MDKKYMSSIPKECIDTDGDGVEDRVDVNPYDNRITDIKDIDKLEETNGYSVINNLKEKEKQINNTQELKENKHSSITR